MAQTKLHQHEDQNNDGKCDECAIEMCQQQKQQGARNLICSRILTHRGQHYDKRAKIHF